MKKIVGLGTTGPVFTALQLRHKCGSAYESMQGFGIERLPYWIGLCFVCVSILFGASLSRAATYYVATTGKDSGNIGTVPSQPFRTIQRAVTLIRPGDTVKISAGRYPAFSLSGVNGASNAPITFEPVSGARVIVDSHLGGGDGLRAIAIVSSSYVVINGIEVTNSDPLISQNKNCDVTRTLDACAAIHRHNKFGSRNGIKINSTAEAPSHHLTLSNLTIYNHAGQAILGGGHHFRILNNHIHDNGAIGEGYGMYITGDSHLIRGNRSHRNNGHGIRVGTDGGASGYVTNTIIEGNRLYENERPFVHYRNFTEPVLWADGGSGITLWHGHGNIIRNNIIYNNGLTGIWLNGDPPFNNQVYNNTIYGNAQGGVYIYHAGESNIIRNNIIVANGPRYGSLTLQNGNVASHNILSGSGGFVDANGFDFRLRPDSPARDKGMTLQAVPVDFAGTVRPQGSAYDIGAYEFSTSSTPPPAVVVCGQNGCEAGETCESCAQDCGPCAVPREISALGVGSITVDGQLNDCGWSQGVWESFSNSDRSDNIVEFSALWDGDNLYLGFDVTDAQLESEGSAFWERDGVEIYLDVLHTESTTMDGDDWRVIVDILASSTQNAVQVAVASTSRGYTLEFGIPWTALGMTPEASKVLGLLVGNNDRDMGSSVQFDWNDLIESGSYSRPNLWGDLRLLPPTAATCEEPSPPTSSPSSCAEVTACVDNDGCCPENCLGTDLDCSLSGTVSCTDDGQGGKICSVTDIAGCDATRSAPSLALLAAVGVLGISALRRRRRGLKVG